MGPEIAIALISWLVTEVVKSLFKLGKVSMPDPLGPLVSVATGGVLGAVPVFQANVLDGIGFGFAAVGLDAGGTTLMRRLGITERKKRERATDATVAPSAVLRRAWLLPLVTIGLLATGCVNTKEASRLLVHGAIDGVCTVSHRAVDTAYGPVEDIQRDVNVTINYVTGTTTSEVKK